MTSSYILERSFICKRGKKNVRSRLALKDLRNFDAHMGERHRESFGKESIIDNVRRKMKLCTLYMPNIQAHRAF